MERTVRPNTGADLFFDRLDTSIQYIFGIRIHDAGPDIGSDLQCINIFVNQFIRRNKQERGS